MLIKQVVLASRNPHKIEELRATLAPLGVELKSALDFPDLEDVVEDGDTLEKNALKKAMYVAKMTSLPSLSDDTGLEVDALGGAPGVYSARYAGEHASYEDNVQKLLTALRGVIDRKARFKTVLAFVDGTEITYFHGVVEGKILTEKRGQKGFGYDPVFLPEGLSQSFAELSEAEKNAISHRGRAVAAFVAWLSSISKDKIVR